jgi:hypothetical protein
MTLEELRSIASARPFRAFVIHLSDGRAVAVLHPEIVTTVPSGETILVHQPDNTIDIIDLPQVMRVALKPAAHGRAREGET